jgi:phosphate transport system permease protein
MKIKFVDTGFKKATTLISLFVVALTLLLVYSMATNAIPSIQKFGARFLFTSTWDPVKENFGALPFIYGTIVSSFLALLIAVPVSLGIAIYLAELAPQFIRQPLSFLIELLAAIPSVIYGLWGIFGLAPFLRLTIQPFLAKYLGFLPIFQGEFYGVGMLTAGIILSIMIIPTISSVSREVFLAVPFTQREAAIALGATPWETIRLAVLGYGRSGVWGAMILGLGRALGETMAVTMVIGNRPEISASLFAPSYTMASVIANEFTEATSNLYLSALVEIGLALFLVTLLVNILARVLIWRVSNKVKGGIRE